MREFEAINEQRSRRAQSAREELVHDKVKDFFGRMSGPGHAD